MRSPPELLAVFSRAAWLGSQRRRCCDTVQGRVVFLSRCSGDTAVVVAHPGSGMAASCLCVKHGFPSPTEFLSDDPMYCICSKPLQPCYPAAFNTAAVKF